MGLPAKKIDAGFSVDQQDMGKGDTFRYNVLSYVVEENYERAIFEMKKYLEKDSEYPKFKPRIERYIAHGVDLVHAIRAKRNFPGAKSLTMSKQQELNEKFKTHFFELQHILKKIEQIQVEERIDDIRSTVWIVRAFITSLVAMAIVAFLLDVKRGLFATTVIVIDGYANEFANWLWKLF